MSWLKTCTSLYRYESKYMDQGSGPQELRLLSLLLLVLWKESFAHKSLYTEFFLHRAAFTHRNFHTQTRLHRDVFT